LYPHFGDSVGRIKWGLVTGDDRGLF